MDIGTHAPGAGVAPSLLSSQISTILWAGPPSRLPVSQSHNLLDLQSMLLHSNSTQAVIAGSEKPPGSRGPTAGQTHHVAPDVRQSALFRTRLLAVSISCFLFAAAGFSAAEETHPDLPETLRDFFSVEWGVPTPVSDPPLLTSAIGKVYGYLVVALRDGTLQCLNCRDGQRAWSANIPLGRPMEMTAGASCVLVLTEEGNLFALDLSDGTLRWEFSALGTLSSPAAEKGMVYVADTGSAYAIDEQTGRTVWTSRLPSASDVKPSVAGHVCCFATSDEQLIALSAADGSGLWSTALSGRVTAPIVSWEKKFYAVTSDRFIFAIDSCSGQVIWKRYAAGTQVTPLIWMAGLLSVGTPASTTFGC